MAAHGRKKLVWRAFTTVRSATVIRPHDTRATGVKKKRDTLEEAIRMIARLQERFAKEGIGLHFTWTAEALPPKKPTPGATNANG